MKQLTCEMCGSTDLVKDGGVFVCQTCGTKYSVEEAKKMMVEGTVEVTGTVKVDNSDFNENYLKMAISAFDNSNNAECESYCNKVIETDPNNYLAYEYKGKAAGWQSTLSNIKINEMTQSFIKAVELAPEEDKDGLVTECVDELIAVSAGLISLQTDNFKKWPDEEESGKIFEIIMTVTKSIVEFNDKYMDRYGGHMLAELNTAIVDVAAAGVVTVNNVMNEYAGEIKKAIQYMDLGSGPNQYDAETLYNKVIACVNTIITSCTVVTKSFVLAPSKIFETESLLLNIFSQGKLIHDALSSMFYLEYNPYSDRYDQKKIPADHLAVSRKLKTEIENCEAEFKQMSSQIKKNLKAEKEEKEKAEAKKRFDDYWAEHAEEKNALNSEKDNLKSQLNQLISERTAAVNEIKKEKNSVSGNDEIESTRKEIKSLQEQKDSLGMFKGKEKKALQEQIDQLESRIKDVEKRINDEISAIDSKANNAFHSYDAQINPIETRIKEIDTELTKPR